MNNFTSTTFATLLLTATSVYATDGHNHSSHDHGNNHKSSDMKEMSHESNMFLVNKQINGYEVSFHVMEAQKGMEHGGSHNFMIKIEQNGKIVSDAKINSKVIHPNGDEESKPLMKMGDWFMNGYDLGHHGKHQMMILFKTADGKKHKGGVYYPGK